LYPRIAEGVVVLRSRQDRMSELWLLRKLARHMTVGVPRGDAAPNVDHILGEEGAGGR
jgi:hypothetical protein